MQIQSVIIGYLCLIVLGFSDNLRGPLFPEILKDLHLSDTSGALFFAISSLFSIIGTFAIRFFYHRFGTIISLKPSLLLLSVGLLGIGIAKSLTFLLAASVLLGVGFGSIGFLQNILVTNGAGPNHPYMRQILSGLHSMYGLSSFLAPVVVTLLYGLNLKWHNIFELAAIAPVLLLIYTWIVGIDRGNDSDSLKDLPQKPQQHDLRHQIFFATMVTVYVLGEVLVSSRLALYIQRTSVNTIDIMTYSSQMVMCFFLSLLASRLLFAFLPWRFSNFLLLQISLMVSAISLIVGLTYAPIGIALAGFGMGPFFPTAIAYAVEVFKERSDSAIWWAITLFSFGLLLMHLSVGIISDHLGITMSLWLAPTFMIAASITLFLERAIYSPAPHSLAKPKIEL